MIRQILKENWQMRRAGDKAARPAVVPGTVYTDLLRNGEMEDPFWKDNEIRALPLMEEDYEYETVFDAEAELFSQDKVLLHFDGIDTIADIFLNGKCIGKADNMHRVWEYDVTGALREKGNLLKAVLYSPLKHIREEFAKCRTLGSEDAMDGFVHMRKAHCMFGWDWGAHLPDAGIFREVSLLGVKGARIDSVYIRQEHEEGKCTLQIEVEERDATSYSPGGNASACSTYDGGGGGSLFRMGM